LSNAVAPAFIAELCIPEQGEARRRDLNQLVAALRGSGLFQNVDSLPEDQRRPLADPSVVLAESHSALLLEYGGDPFEPLKMPVPRRVPVAAGPPEMRAAPGRAAGAPGESRTNGAVRRSGG
jgi:hypothetical protein